MAFDFAAVLEDAPSSSIPIPTDDEFRTSAIHLEGSPISELPTGKVAICLLPLFLLPLLRTGPTRSHSFVIQVFTYISSYTTALPIGIEWLSDTRLLAVFPSASQAATALEHLLLSPSQFAAAFSKASPMSDVLGEAQKVPVGIWPDQFKAEGVKGKGRGRKVFEGGEVGGKMRIDGAGRPEDGEEARGTVEAAREAGEKVMKGEIQIRWARTTDRKGNRVSLTVPSVSTRVVVRK